MDLNWVLIWTVLVWAAFAIGRVARARSGNMRGWVIVFLTISAITVACLLAVPDKAGLIGGGLWALLVVIPSIGAKAMQSLAAKQHYEKARRLALVLRWFHPADGWREQPEILLALALADQGKTERARDILQRHRSAEAPLVLNLRSCQTHRIPPQGRVGPPANSGNTEFRWAGGSVRRPTSQAVTERACIRGVSAALR